MNAKVVIFETLLNVFFYFQKVNISKLYHSMEIWAQTMSGAGAVPFCEELALKQGKVKVIAYI